MQVKLMQRQWMEVMKLSPWEALGRKGRQGSLTACCITQLKLGQLKQKIFVRFHTQVLPATAALYAEARSKAVRMASELFCLSSRAVDKPRKALHHPAGKNLAHSFGRSVF